MSHPTKRQALVKAARQEGTFIRVKVPRTTCERCSRDAYALPDGSPRAHLRPTLPGEPLFSAIVPTMTTCEE